MPTDARTVSPFHVLHRWSQWGDVDTFNTQRLPEFGAESAVAGDRMIETTVYVQRRSCAVCGKQQRRYL